MRGKADLDQMVMDVRAAVDALRAEGLKVGVVGYCLGGTLAWLSATRIPGVAAAVGYYGGGIGRPSTRSPRARSSSISARPTPPSRRSSTRR